METIVITNYTNQECYLENIDDDILETKYEGSIMKYIEDSYNLEGCDYSWYCVLEVIDYSAEGKEVEISRVY